MSVPALAISAAVRLIVRFVLFTNVVVRFAPFTCATEAATNPVPLRVSVKPALPASTEVGLMLVSVGTGLLTAKLSALVVPPPGAGFVTVTLAEPVFAMSAAAIAACNCVAFTSVVVLAEPFQFTTDVLLKFVPFTVKVNAAPPTIVVFGLKLVRVGAGLAAACVTV